MQEKSKKILRRIGAGFLLGLSFLSFGSSWGRQRAKGTPRRAQNIRKETQEELDSEVKAIADIAEKEAQDVINQQMQQQTQQQQMQQQTQTRTQAILRFATIGGWGVAMGVFFTSMIFNQPFGLGKAVLSLLPGEPHVAVLTANTNKDTYQVDEDIKVDINLATNQEKVNYFKIAINYEPTILELEKINIDKNKFDSLESSSVDKKNGNIIIVAKKTGRAENLKKDIIASLTFKALQKTDKAYFKIRQQDSLVIKKKNNGRSYNILGKTKNAKFKITKKINQLMKCTQVDIVKSRMDREQWEWLINSAPIPLKEGNNWVYINNDISLLCAYSNDGGVYILIHSDKNIKDAQLVNTITGKVADIVKKDKWTVGDNNFYELIFNSNQFTKELSNKLKNIKIILDVGGNHYRWPGRGSGEVLLQKSLNSK